jgi:acyl carrier protein
MERQSFLDAIAQYFIRKNPNREPPGPQANLWTLGYVDSLRIVELIIYVENITGSELTLRDANSISSIDAIYNEYVKTDTGS